MADGSISTCTTYGCPRAPESSGLCNTHYRAELNRRHGVAIRLVRARRRDLIMSGLSPMEAEAVIRAERGDRSGTTEDRERRQRFVRVQEEIARQRAQSARIAAEKEAARLERIATKAREAAKQKAAWDYARSPEGREEARQRKREAQNERKAELRAESDREMLLALYDHPATARFLRLVNAGRWEPEVHLPVWLDAAEEIPEDLRSFAIHVRAEFDPFYRVAVKIANLGGDTLDTIARLYGLTRERIRQIEEDGVRHLRRLREVRDMRECLENNVGHIPGLRDRIAS